MSTTPSLGGFLLRATAVVFMAATALYSLLWMYSVRRERTGFLGVVWEVAPQPSLVVVLREVVEGGPAQRAGLRAGDRIVGLNGRPLESFVTLNDAVAFNRPGDRLALTVERPGAAAPLGLEATLGPPPPRNAPPLAGRVAGELTASYPVLFLIAVIVVLALRVEDPNAWGLALLFAAFIAMAPLQEHALPASLRRFSAAYWVLFNVSSGAIFLYFFSVFPTASPLDRRAPWLKWLWLATAIPVAVFLAAGAFLGGGRSRPEEATPLRSAILVHVYAGFGLGFLSLVWNGLRGTPVVRRKIRVVVWGTLLGVGPAILFFGAAQYLGADPYAVPFWVWAPWVILLSLLPLSFVYAVLKHRVLEIPALLRRSARYLLVQRGSLGLLVLLGIAAGLYFAMSLGGRVAPRREPLAVGLGVGFGTFLVWSGTQLQRRVRERIDRAFFRGAYDARRLLEELAEKARGAGSRTELAALLEQQVRSALLPSSLAVYVESRDSELRLTGGAGPEALPASSPLLADLARQAEPLELPPEVASEPWAAALGAECLVPILGRHARLNGLLALGPRLSEEPYSSEDERLLAAVASQAGITLDSIRLAEQMAERLEAERVAAHERELAQRVQARLLPQEAPTLRTLELGGRCVQARAVGGDYYDFLELGRGRVGLALGDISGKGFPAALLMATLQASLRSRSGEELLDLPRSLGALNQLLYRSSEASRYASLFLGVYDEDTRRLRYANCGHNPPLLLRADGSVERLPPTAPVLGLITEWECATGERALGSGDLLAVFSDGITEAFSPSGEEFGEGRLLELLRTRRAEPVAALIEAVVREARDFSDGDQQDDQTLLVARVRGD